MYFGYIQLEKLELHKKTRISADYSLNAGQKKSEPHNSGGSLSKIGAQIFMLHPLEGI